MALDENTVDIDVTDITNDAGEIIGFEAKYQDAGREYVISYDADFKKTGETVTKLYDVIELTATDQSFQDAWASINSDLSGVTGDQTLYFAEVNDSQLVVLGDGNTVLLRVSVWEGSHTWTGWDGTNYRNDDAHYNFHDADWEHLGSAGSNNRYIVRDGEDDILDETGTHLGFSTQDADGIASALGDYAEYSSEYLETDAEGFSITRVQSQSSSWSGLDHALREEGFETWTDSNERIEIFGGEDGDDDFVGSIELREGFLVVRDENWNTLARLLDGDGLTIEDVEAEYAGFSDAWSAVSEFLPAEFQPDVDEDSLKFSIDDWDNVIVFDADGEMIGRVHTWEHTHTWTDYRDGSEYTKAHTSTGFNFNDVNWNNIGFYETSESNYTHKDDVELDASIPDETSTFTSYALHKEDATVAMWANIGGNYYLPRLSDEMIEQVETALEMTWSDVAQINIGQRDQIWLDNQFRDGQETGSDTRVEYFAEVEHDGGYSHFEFLGSVELRDGFIEVRDSNWNEVVRVIDVTQGKTIDEVEAEHAGFKAAYEQVGEFLPKELRDEGVRFTSDDWNIYAFSAAGELLSNINFWNGEHTWTSWDGTEYKNIDTHYNFHDENWQSLANSGSNERYIVVDGGDDILDEQGSNYGYTVSSEFLVGKVLEDLNPGVASYLDLDDVAQVRLNTNSWQGLDHDYREDDFEPWSDSEKRIDLFKAVQVGEGDNAYTHMERIGQVAERDGFIEIYDENWQTLARLVDGDGLSLDDIEAEFPGFTQAWEAVSNYMPSEFRPELEESSLKFTLGEWDNILVFDANGALIGRVGVWEHTNEWTNYNDGAEYTVENNSINFNFNDDDWNNIGRYEVRTREYTEKDGEPLSSPIADETQIYTSYSLYATDAEWATFKGEFDLPALTTDQQNQLGFTWADVDQISIGKSETTGVVNQFRDEEETWSDTRVEYFEAVEHEWGTHYEFLGSLEARSGFLEVRDSDWNTVVRKIDISSARTLSEIASMHDGFEEAWNSVEVYLPSELQADDVRFTSDDWNIYAFSAAGELLSNINFWNGEHTWEGWNGIEYRNVDSHYNFHDENWNSLANAGTFERWAIDEDGNEYLDETGSNSGFTAYDSGLSALLDTVDDKVFTKLGISESDITSARQQTNSWKSLDHDLRDEWFEPFENTNQRIEFFETETFGEGDHTHTHEMMIGSMETRGSFIEIYDENWMKVGQIMSGSGLSIDQIDAEYSGFKAAWTAVSDDLPSDFKAAGVKFVIGEWDNILIFDSSDEMIGRVDTWTWTDPDTKYRKGEEYTRVYESVSFNFNDENWNNIARHETFSSTYTEKEGVALETPIVEEDGVFTSISMLKDDFLDVADWNLLEDSYGLPENLSSEALEQLFMWSEVDQISVGTRTETRYETPFNNDEEHVFESKRIEYFSKEGDDYGSWYKFLGMVESEGGFYRVRNEFWEDVASVADTSQLETWNDIKGDFYKLEESWTELSDALPTELKIANVADLQFSVSEPEREIYVFDTSGTMYEIDFNVEVNTLTRSGQEVVEYRYWYEFEPDHGPSFGNIGGNDRFLKIDGAEVADESGVWQSSRIMKDDLSDSEWEEFNPNNAAIEFSDVTSIQVGTNSWESFENVNRTADQTWSNNRETVEYYGTVTNDGHSDDYRMGSLERDGFLETIYDANWNPVDQQLGGDIDGIPLTALFEVEASHMKEAFEFYEPQMAAFEGFNNLNSIIVTPTKFGEDGQSVIEAALSDVISGEIVGTLHYDEWDNSRDVGWSVRVEGLRGDDEIDLFDVMGHNLMDDDGYITDVANGVSFATYTVLDELKSDELADLKTKYAVMDNVEGFNWDNVLKIKEREEIWDFNEDPEDHSFETQVRFVENMGDGNSNWDYFELENEGGLITVENKATDEIVYSTFVAGPESTLVRDVVGPNYDAILDKVQENHTEVFNANLSNVDDLTLYFTSGEDVVVIDETGTPILDGWFDINGPYADGNVWWETTLRDIETGERIINVGGRNKLVDEETGHFAADGITATRVGEYFYKRDMTDTEWSNLISQYSDYEDELPDGTLENAGVVNIKLELRDNDGDGDYSSTRTEIRFNALDPSERDGINWDWEDTIRIREEGFGYQIFQGDDDNELAYGTDFDGVSFVDPDAADLAKFNDLVAVTDILEGFMDTVSLKAASDNSDSLVLIDNADGEVAATVTDYETYYGFRDPATSEFIGWIWSENIEGIDHSGYGFDLEDIGQGLEDADKTAIMEFLSANLAPSSGDYSVEDIAEHRLVVRQAKDGDTVVEQYAYVQHFDADGNTIGSAGVDVLNSKFIQLYDRMQAVGGETPKETEITGAETAAIFASINNIMDALVNDGSVGTLSGLNNSTVITPLPSEESSGDGDEYDVEVFVNADKLLSLDTDHGSKNVSVKRSSEDDVVIGTNSDSDPVLHIMSGDSSANLSTLFSDGIASNVSLADVIVNWPSIIPAITTANGNGDDYVLDVMAMTEANMMLWHGSEDDSYSDSSSGSYSQSGTDDGHSDSMDNFDPDGFIAEWMIDSVQDFVGFDADTLKSVSKPTFSFGDEHDGDEGSSESDTDGDGHTLYFEDDDATVFLEIHSSSELTDEQVLDVIDLVFFDDAATYEDII